MDSNVFVLIIFISIIFCVGCLGLLIMQVYEIRKHTNKRTLQQKELPMIKGKCIICDKMKDTYECDHSHLTCFDCLANNSGFKCSGHKICGRCDKVSKCDYNFLF